MRPAPTSRLRGTAVGAVSAALAVAAHGYGGGELPSSSGIVLLLIAAAVVGSVVAESSALNRGALPLLAALLSGQLLGHLILSTSAGHELGHSVALAWPMVLAHLAAALGCAALIVLVERLYGPLAALIRAVTHPVSPAVRPLVARHPEARRPRIGAAVLLHSISRRGPPVFA